MARVLKRPMFRRGGSTNDGIMSGLEDREKFATQGTILDVDRARLESKAIQDMGTDNGKCLVLNAHVSARGHKDIQYPSSIDEAENIDPFAKLMFEMSSIIPAPFLGGYNNLLVPGARFYTLNADICSSRFFFGNHDPDMADFRPDP